MMATIGAGTISPVMVGDEHGPDRGREPEHRRDRQVDELADDDRAQQRHGHEDQRVLTGEDRGERRAGEEDPRLGQRVDEDHDRPDADHRVPRRDVPDVDGRPRLGGRRSNEVGGYLRGELSGRNVRLQCELGGKNVSVVLEDADLDMTAATVASAAFAQAGQRCTATSRLIVAGSVASVLTSKLRAKVAEIVLGPGLDPATRWGR
jgi:Aldehyde dehydrogenase family